MAGACAAFGGVLLGGAGFVEMADAVFVAGPGSVATDDASWGDAETGVAVGAMVGGDVEGAVAPVDCATTDIGAGSGVSTTAADCTCRARVAARSAPLAAVMTSPGAVEGREEPLSRKAFGCEPDCTAVGAGAAVPVAHASAVARTSFTRVVHPLPKY